MTRGKGNGDEWQRSERASEQYARRFDEGRETEGRAGRERE